MSFYFISFDGKQRWKSMINTYERKCTFCVRLCTKYLKSRDYLSLCGKEANECSYSVLTNSFVTDSNPEFDSVFDSRQYFSYWIEPFFFCQIQNFSFSSIKTKANRTFNDIKDFLSVWNQWSGSVGQLHTEASYRGFSISFLIERQKSFQEHISLPDRNPLWNQEMGKLHLVQNLKMNVFWLIHFQ